MKGTFRGIDRCSVGEILELESSIAVFRRLLVRLRRMGIKLWSELPGRE